MAKATVVAAAAAAKRRSTNHSILFELGGKLNPLPGEVNLRRRIGSAELLLLLSDAHLREGDRSRRSGNRWVAAVRSPTSSLVASAQQVAAAKADRATSGRHLSLWRTAVAEDSSSS